MALKDEILIALKNIESNARIPAVINRKTVPVMLLFMELGASLNDMKTAITELVNEKKILFYSDDLATRVMKTMNQKEPAREVFMQKPTEDELFVCGHVINIDG